MFFDPARVVTNPHAVALGRRDPRLGSSQLVLLHDDQALAKHYKFDVTKPWNQLAEKVRNIVLYGNDGEKIQFKYENEKKGNKSGLEARVRGHHPEHAAPLLGDREPAPCAKSS